MSSAALQAAPHQSTTITSLGPHSSSTASPSNRQYGAQPSQTRDPYHGQQNAASSPSSARRPSRRPSANGATSTTATTGSPQQQSQPQFYSPSGSASSNPQAATAAAAAAAARSAASNGHQQYLAVTATPSDYSSDNQRGVAPIAPPRSSSNQRASSATGRGSSSRRGVNAATERSASSTREVEGAASQQDRTDRAHGNGYTAVNGSDATAREDSDAARSRNRRRAQQSTQEQPVPTRSTSTRGPRTQTSAPNQRAHAPMAGSASKGPSREPSEVLNRVVVSQPEVDIRREQERMAIAQPSSSNAGTGPVSPVPITRASSDDKITKARQDHGARSSKREKNTKFGDYFIGNTVGEGEFGKVKMGWKQEGGVQVAIKFIRRDSVGSNPNRLAKIYREIAILREISHPNIVRLHEMVETEKHIGIILEYASGGELFDYILNHRYLKDNAARRLFAQLVSGVGYLHKKGIVHRDLKLENLLLDRNRNIIITDFGFANTFDPADELGEEVEYNLSNKDYIRKMELDKTLKNGFRRGDLMQTSCGSPCYAAPELVVSDSLYTGRKVDVWSCGVILYAMLAGYLPFDDDPANPEGDNINLLYKYIVSTPLTFPEYVTPHARDLLRRILVPDPRKRADLFEIARHSWLSEYADVVAFITSSTTTSLDIANATVGSEDHLEAPLLTRSASVREPSSKTQKVQTPAIGDLTRKYGNVDPEQDDVQRKSTKDTKRRTVQLEYVGPKTHTTRGEAPTSTTGQPRTRNRSDSEGPVEVPVSQAINRNAISSEKPLPRDPPTSARDARNPQGSRTSDRRPTDSQKQQSMPAPSRPNRDPPRAVSDATYMTTPAQTNARPTTGGSLTSNMSRNGSMGLPTRNSYGQPAAPTVTNTNTHSHISQPKNSKNYIISNPIPQTGSEAEYGRPRTNHSAKVAQLTGGIDAPKATETKGHKRSSTIGGIGEKIFGRSTSFFGGKSQQGERPKEKQKKSYPPVSMSGPISSDNPRPSMESSRRSISFGFGKKRSGSVSGSQTGGSQTEKTRRLSFLPASFSLKSIGIGKDYGQESQDEDYYQQRPDSNGELASAAGARGEQQQQQQQQQHQQARLDSRGGDHAYKDGQFDGAPTDSPVYPEQRVTPSDARQAQYQHQRFPTGTQQYASSTDMSGANSASQRQAQRPISNRNHVNPKYQNDGNSESDSSFDAHRKPNRQRFESQGQVNLSESGTSGPRYPPGFNGYDSDEAGKRSPRDDHRSGVLHKNNRRFADEWEAGGDVDQHGGSAGSSGAARKVMDFFRRRGKARGDA